MRKKTIEVPRVVILGANGDLGFSFSNYAIRKNIPLKIVVREDSFPVFSKQLLTNKDVVLDEVETLFNLDFLKKMLNESIILYNLTGLVSLKFSRGVYPEVILINAVFPALLSFLNHRKKIPIIYPSTQRMFGFKGRAAQIWVKKLAKDLSRFIVEKSDEPGLEKVFLSRVRALLKTYPVPSGKNIYDLSKALGEKLLSLLPSSSLILRISSCYGPNCSQRKTIGRLIVSRFLNISISEKEEIRDYLYIEDMNEILYKLRDIKKQNLVEYCCSGTGISKSQLVKMIFENTPNKLGPLKVISGDNETFLPSAEWTTQILRKKPVPLKTGLKQSVEYIRRQLLDHNHMNEKGKISSLYDKISQQTVERGLDSDELEAVRTNFFSEKSGTPHESFWKPTGLVLGYPLPEVLTQKIDILRKEILGKILGLNPGEYWLIDLSNLHITIVNYSHYSEVGLNVVPLPESEFIRVKKIVADFGPITVNFDGALITSNGSVVLKGFVYNDQLSILRNRLRNEIDGITQMPQELVHLKIAQILDNVSYETIIKANKMYRHADLGEYTFDHVTGPRREKYELAKVT